MGDRVSISFVNGAEKSVALFNHYGGVGFVEHAKGYARGLITELKALAKVGTIWPSFMPLTRLEPSTVMVDYITHLERASYYFKQKYGDRVWSNLYIGKDEHEGVNSDNGHHEIDLAEIAKQMDYDLDAAPQTP